MNYSVALKITKRCGKCGKRKNIATGFHKHSQAKCGYHSQCRECRNSVERSRTRGWYWKNVDKAREYSRNYQREARKDPHYQRYQTAYQKQYRARKRKEKRKDREAAKVANDALNKIMTIDEFSERYVTPTREALSKDIADDFFFSAAKFVKAKT